MPRLFSLVDVGVITVVAVAIFLPSREMWAGNVIKGDETKQFAVALAEARTMARPGDGLAAEELAKHLGEAGLKDWAVEASVKASERGKDSPTRWHAYPAGKAENVDVLRG